MTVLGKRLSAVAEMIKPGGAVADIGYDHALLPIYLMPSPTPTEKTSPYVP